MRCRRAVALWSVAIVAVLAAASEAQTGVITTVAGSGTPGYSGDGGPATLAALHAAPARLDVAVDSIGNLYVADVANCVIRRVDAITHVITTVVGTGEAGYAGDGGPARLAQLSPNPSNRPVYGTSGGVVSTGIFVDRQGNLLIADTGNNRIRRVDALTGVINTVAGNGTPGLSGDGGPAIDACLNEPKDAVVDRAGNILVADTRNHRIRRVDATTGIITTVAGASTGEPNLGYSGDGGPATQALMDYPWSICVDGQDNVFITNPQHHRIRRVDGQTGIITTIAGDGVTGFAGDGGAATQASLRYPRGLALDGLGGLYIADFYNRRVRRVDLSSGIIVTVAGNGAEGYSGDGGLAPAASLGYPTGLACYGAGIYIGDTANHRVRMVSPADPNWPPTARAGADQRVTLGTVVRLDGSSSSDADGDSLRFRWGAPQGISLDDTTAIQPTFTTGATAGLLAFTLTVTDARGASASDTVVVAVSSPPDVLVSLPGGAAMPLVWVEPGAFAMGSTEMDTARHANESPQHQVTLTSGYYLAATELTQGQWESVMATRPWAGRTHVQESAGNPAVYVSWNDAQELVHRLNLAVGDSLYRLPTEAEWEYACRAGTATRWSFGDDGSQLGQYAWYAANAWNVGRQYGQPVGMKLANPYGLYDMHGNVFEWVQDWYGAYRDQGVTDPLGPPTGTERIARGGNVDNEADRTRSADREIGGVDARSYRVGVRLLRTAAPAHANTAPRSDAGPDQRVTAGARVHLDGSASSDADGDTLSYRWTAPSGISLSDPSAMQPTFSTGATAGGATYAFSLVVNDGSVDSGSDTVVVRVTAWAGQTPPRIEPIGPRLVAEGDSLTVVLAASDADGDSLTFGMANAPAGSSLQGPVFSWRPGFCQSGTYLVTFAADDGAGGVASEVVRIVVTDSALPALWSVSLTLTGPNGLASGLLFGLAPAATDGVDDAYGETALPPAPPLPVADVRWALPGTEGTAVDIRGAGAGGYTWTALVHAGVAGYPIAVGWDPTGFPSQGAIRLIDAATAGGLINVDMRRHRQYVVSNPGLTQLQVVFQPSTTLGWTYDLPAGWSLVSLPFAVPDARLSTVFPTALSLFAFAGQYVPATTLAPGQGYWVNLPSPCRSTVSGLSPQPPALARELTAGWSLVGPGSVALEVGTLKAACPQLVSAFGYGRGYQLVQRLEPGQGYWLNLSAGATLDLGATAVPALLGKTMEASGLSGGGPVLWAEGPGGCQALTMGGPVDASIALPPVPPTGVFDARVEVAPGVAAWRFPDGGGPYRVRLQGAVSQLRWDMGADTAWQLEVAGEPLPLLGQGQVPVGDGDDIWVRQVAATLVRTRLGSTYPNPFNSTTTIEYYLAQAGRVCLQVYAVSGQCVRELVWSQQGAGVHQLDWDGRDTAGRGLGNGVYLVGLRVGGSWSVARVVLLK